mgnify:CR=1 FL=1
MQTTRLKAMILLFLHILTVSGRYSRSIRCGAGGEHVWLASASRVGAGDLQV